MARELAPAPFCSKGEVTLFDTMGNVINEPLKKVVHANHQTVSAVKRHWLTIAFILGFVVDNLTLNRVDQLFDNLILAFYVVLAMAALLLMYASAADKIEGKAGDFFRKYAVVAVQYAFGGLLSGMLIFYGRSGSWADSWPFLLIILLAIYGNETLHDRVSRLIYNLAILFIGLLTYVVLLIPVISGKMGPWVFFGSALLALVIMAGYVQLVRLIVPRFIALHFKSIIFTVGAIYVGLNFLYFANIIPPIPLSLKEVGVYHSVVRFENGDYELKYEKGSWWQPLKKSDDVYHARPGDNIFCFAQVFAPTRLSTEIFHRWEYYDEAKREWVEHLRTSYSIAGGRDSGYRGYTLIKNYRDGQWRCSVETSRGQVLGREKFEVDSTKPPEELISRIQ